MSNDHNASSPGVQSFLLDALEIADPAQREAYLGRVCRGDAALRAEVEELLRAERAMGRFLPAEPRNGTAGGWDSLQGEKPGDLIGRYKLIEPIGEGGCGVVYLAEQREPVRRPVALKVIKLGMDTRRVIARFEAERQALAMMDHPNIARVLDAGATANGRPFFVMELVRGVRITEYADTHALTTEARLRLFAQVCQAAQHAHQKGIIHRDLKPSNILVTEVDGAPVPKVIDFGIAKATEGRLKDASVFTGFHQFLGTPAYMSPEQASMTSLDIDTRSDVYSLGVLLYELLTGRTPFETKSLLAEGLEAMQRTIREKEPVRPSTRLTGLSQEDRTTVARQRGVEVRRLPDLVRGDLDAIVAKCLEKQPGRRYQTAQELAQEIQRHLQGDPIQARPVGAMGRSWRWCRRRPAVAGLLAAIVGLVATIAVGSTVAAYRIAQQRGSAQENVVRQYVGNGTRLLNDGDLFGALLWYTAALRLDAGRPGREEVHRIRIASVLENCPRLSRVVTHGSRLFETHFSQDGQSLVTSADDGTARLWSLAHAEEVRVFHHAATGNVYTAASSPDDRWVATGGEDRRTRVWDAHAGSERHAPLQHGAPVWFARFSPDGTRLVTCEASGDVSLWDCATGRREGEPLRHSQGVYAASFSQDGRWLATIDNGWNAVVWDLKTRERRLQTQAWDSQDSVSFSPDSRQLVTCGGANVRVWNLTTFREEPYSPLLHKANAKCAVFSPDGRRIGSVGEDRVMRIWDAATGQRIASTPDQSTTRFTVAAFSPDGRYALAAGDSPVCTIHTVEDGRVALPLLRQPAPVRAAEFHPDSRRVLLTGEDQKVRIWDLATPDSIPAGRPRLQDDRRLFSADQQRLLVLGPTNSLLITDAGNGAALKVLPHAGRVTYATYSPDGRTILTACANRQEYGATLNNLFVWDAATGRRLSGTNMQGTSPLLYAAFSPDGHRILACGADLGAQVWDLDTGRPVTPVLHHYHRIHWGCFDPDGKRVLTASADRMVRVWDARTGEPLTASLAHPHRVVGADWSRDRTRVQTFMSDGEIQSWDLQGEGPMTMARPTVVLPRLQAAGGGPARVATPAADTRSVAGLLKLAQFLNASRVDDRGGVHSLDPQRWSELRAELEAEGTERFLPTAAEAVAWHTRQVQASIENEAWTTARFHAQQVLLATPGDPGMAAEFSRIPAAPTGRAAPGPEQRAAHGTVVMRDPTLPANLVNLETSYTSGLNQDHGNDFSEIHAGRQLLAGVPFDVRGVIALSGRSTQRARQAGPERVDHIRIGLKCHRLHFLHSMEYDANDGEQVGTYVLHYADGEVRELPILAGRHLWGWYGMPGLPARPGDAVVAWAGGSRATLLLSTFARLYKSTRENPRPDLEITEIDFVSSMGFAAPFLVALTLE